MQNKSLTLTAANTLYLAAMLLVISLGAWLQSLSLAWGLIATEIFCILVPALVVLRRGKIPLASGAGLPVSNWKITVVSLVLGFGAWMVGVYIDHVMVSTFGLPQPQAGTWLPETWGQGLLWMVALAVFAPVCEEILFRGMIQPAYERYGRWLGVVVPSLMFAFFHMRLIGLPALIPIVFLLGYTYYRTRSLGASIALHFGNNFLAAVLAIASGLHPEWVPDLQTPTYGGFGLILVCTGLILLTRLTGKPVLERQPQPVKVWAWLALAAAVAVYAGMVSLSGEAQAVFKARPENLPALSLQAPTEIAAATYTYEMRNRMDEPVGQMICQVQPEAGGISLFCDATVQAFEFTQAQSYFKFDAFHRTITARWDAATLELQSARLVDEPGQQWQAERGSAGLTLSAANGAEAQPAVIPDGALLPFEMFFRLAYLPRGGPSAVQARVVSPSMWDETTQTSHVSQETVAIYILPPETLNLPAGEYPAVPAHIGAFLAAWYTQNEPSFPVKMSDEVFDYLLLAE